MLQHVLLSAAAALGLAFIAPPAAEARGKGVNDAAFSAELQKARSFNPWQEIARLEVLAKDKRLSKTQRASVLYSIAGLYGTTAPDKPRAIATYQQMLKLDPKHPMAASAKEKIDYLNTQMGHIRRRIELRQASLYDRMMMGEYETIISEMKASEGRIGASEIDARNLYYAGWFCKNRGMSAIGSMNTEKFRVGPCETRQNPININPLRRL
jgi:hypothetical protein